MTQNGPNDGALQESPIDSSQPMPLEIKIRLVLRQSCWGYHGGPGGLKIDASPGEP